MAEEGLQTLDRETKKPPESRVKDIASVRERINSLKAGDDERSERRTQMQGLIDGNRPYVQSKMIAAGRGDDANINFREAEGRVAAATTPYYELCFGVPRAADIQVYWGDNKQKMYEWGERISDRYSETLWAWPDYKINLQLSHYQMVVFGHGPILWSRKRGWHFEAKQDDSVLVADNAMCSIDKLPEAALPGHYNPVDLFKLIDEAPDSSGWNKKVGEQAIIDAAPKSMKDGYGHDWAGYQASLRRGDTLWNNKESRIYYTDYLVKEFTGKITHCIVLDTQIDTSRKGQGDFLFKKIGKFDSFRNIINPFHFDVGPDGHWYSVKGLGPKIYDSCDLSNRFYCTLINGAMASCGIPLQAMNATALQKIQQTPLVRASGITFIPPDWSVQQMNMRGAMDGPLQVIDKINNIVESNTGQYQQLDDTPQPTLGQEQIEASARSTLTRGAYDRYCHYLDDMHLEILRRMLDPDISEKDAGGKEAIEMRRKLIEEDEVPEECLDMDNICSVRAVRAVGYGSAQMQKVVGQGLLARLGTMDEEGRRNALRLVTASEVGQSNVDRFYKKFEDTGVPNDQEAQAGMENVLLRTPSAGTTLAVTPAMNPAIHFVSHTKNAMENLQLMKAGQADPIQTVTLLDNTGVHNHRHLDAMQGDPTREEQLKTFVKMQMMLGKMTDELKKQVAQAQAANQQPQPNIDTDHAEKLLQIILDDKRKTAKMVRDEQRKDEKFQFEKRLKDLRTADDINRSRMNGMAA